MRLSGSRLGGVCVAVAATAAMAATVAPAGAAAAPKRLYVDSGPGPHSGRCTKQAPCKKIKRGVARAKSGQIVSVAGGTYREEVKVNKSIRLLGVHRAKVNAKGKLNGIVVKGPGAAGAVVRGFVVKNATQEGILAERTSDVTIRHNVARHNDLGAKLPHPTGECAEQGQVPGDCGEGIHLLAVEHSTVAGNHVTRNSGGILLTDEFGPTDHNTVAHNDVFQNAADCGITIAGHNPKAVVAGKRQRKVAGVYHNRISHNVSNQNGLKGEGAGILLATAGPGAGVYSNLVKDNVANGNDLAGVTLHSHAPGDDLNDNSIVHNKMRNDNRGGDPDAKVSKTAGIIVFSAFTPLKGTVVQKNNIRHVHFGIWTQNVPRIPRGDNDFRNVAVPVFQQ